jgi:hypothetical protein
MEHNTLVYICLESFWPRAWIEIAAENLKLAMGASVRSCAGLGDPGHNIETRAQRVNLELSASFFAANTALRSKVGSVECCSGSFTSGLKPAKVSSGIKDQALAFHVLRKEDAHAAFLECQYCYIVLCSRVH